tara:strand:+ start:430 stop:591 length:162 start_codon:yes stop_codon:yes gene_type:complete
MTYEKYQKAWKKKLDKMTYTYYILESPLGDFIIFLLFGVLRWVKVVKGGNMGF